MCSELFNDIAGLHQTPENVVATFYHELAEARTNPNVESGNSMGTAGHQEEKDGERTNDPCPACVLQSCP